MGAPTTINKKRLKHALFGITVMFAVLVMRLFSLQVIGSAELQQKALSQWTRTTVLDAARGKILDCNGDALAQSATAFKVLIWPVKVREADRSRVATELANILQPVYEHITYEYVLERVSDTDKSEIVLCRQITRDKADEITALKLGEGIVLATDTKRYYPYDTLLSQVLGFTSIDGNGQEGLELKYNKYLAGENGRMLTERDNKGNSVAYGTQEYIEPVDGCDIVLTIDATIQSFLEKALEEALEVNNAKNAQGIIMNAKTGAIVAVATTPGYDPNTPPRNDLDALSELSRNRLVTDAYEPGSTFKIVTLASALDCGAISEGYQCSCPGFKIVGGQRIKCWRSGGHGQQNLEECAQNSCNTAFMDMALEMGTETFYDYIYKFGLGSATGSGLSGEASGIVINKKYIRDINLARIGFGQSIAMTPIQLVTAVCAAVNGGNLMQPYIIDRIVTSDGQVIQQADPTPVRRVISDRTSNLMRQILESVVANGSGRNAQIPGFRIGGKTGTAQKYDENGQVANGKLIASFVGIAPIDDPELVCLILVDEPQVGVIFGSTVAAPFVKNVLQESLSYYNYIPDGVQNTVTVPELTGLTISQAIDLLDGLGLEATYQDMAGAQIAAQIPQTGTLVVSGSNVLLYTENTGILTNDESVQMPNLSGMTRLEAFDILKEYGLIMEIDGEYSGGDVSYQSVRAGESVAVGTHITVRFS